MRTLIKNEIFRMFALLCIVAIPFLLLLLYTRLSIKTSLLERDIHSLSSQRNELMRKNNALKEELMRLAGRSGLDRMYWKKSGTLPFYIRNKVVTVKLDSISD